MALLCYRKGCGQRFDPEGNTPDACLHHPGLPIFHDALKGWSCCKKRTTDFSEFLAIKGCTKGYHSDEKPPMPEVASAVPATKTCTKVAVQGPKSTEMMQRQRPSSDEPRQLLVMKVSQALQNILEKLQGQPPPRGPGGALEVSAGTACKNSGCQAVYQGEESDTDTCRFHPGVPVFHEGLKFWSCCGIKTTDFAAFLEQMGCSRGRHTWVQEQGRQPASCRHDWHQTNSQVVVTLYAKTPLPQLSSIRANRTVLDIHVVFEGSKVFQAELDLWGVISMEKSFASLLPSKVEITLKKESPIPWARLERPQSRGPAQRQQEQPMPPPEPDATAGTSPGGRDPSDDSDDSLSWSEEEWEDRGENQAEDVPAGAPEIQE